MKHGRAKAARKTLKFFSLNANIKPPYKVILDGNFLAAAIKYKTPIIERIGNILQTTEFSLFVTRSAIVELGNLSSSSNDNEGVFADARQFGLDECEILERPNEDENSEDNGNVNNDNEELTPSHDIQNLVKDGNKHGYFVATQDKALSDVLRDMVNVPQMWLTKGGVLIFDTPSAASRKYAQREERVKQKTGGGTMTPDEASLIRRLREQSRKEKNTRDGTNQQQGIPERKKRKAKGPNPLSCKKKKTETEKVLGEKRKRRRRKKTNEE